MKKQQKRSYTQLIQQDRDRMDAMLETGIKQVDIARILGVDPSTISREKNRNRRQRTPEGVYLKEPGPYEASMAQHKTYVRRKYATYQGKKIHENKALRAYVISKLKLGWSPKVISGRMKLEKQPCYASKTAIYAWLNTVEGETYKPLLAHGKKGYRKKSKGTAKAAHIPARMGIAKRPIGATNRSRYGHYEGDTMLSGKKTGSKAALSVTYGRKEKYIGARKVYSLVPGVMTDAVNDMMEVVVAKSMTLDNGLENRAHQDMDVPAFFCDPYASWQKGGVEHAIGMIRRYIPKGTDIDSYSVDEIQRIVARINHTPRESLGYKTPHEVMCGKGLFKQNVAHTNKKIPAREIALRG